MVRTKQTGKAKPKPNGTHASSPTTPSKPPPNVKSPKSPDPPTELSELERAKMKSWLDKQEKPFTVQTAPLTRKRKRTSGLLQAQMDLFEDRLSVQYEVKPRDKWECLKRYKKFTVGTESIAVGECVLVEHGEPQDARIDLHAQWKAKVLEVRALDSEHVYVRVAWLNRPEDLETGRKPYHGRNELVPTNQMDMIDAMTVNGSLNLLHWDDTDDDSQLMNEEQFFWRQTYDFVNTQTFSKLRTMCIDEAPQNPDEMILQCGNADCRQWQHVKCIAETAVQAAADKASGSKKKPSPAKKGRPKTANIASNSPALAKAQKDAFTAEVLIAGLPDADDRKASVKNEIIITDAEGVKHSEPVNCLMCGKAIE